MSKLERWLPFMFKKKNQQEKQKESQRVAVEQSALAPSALHTHLGPFYPLASSPMQQLVESFFSDPFFRDPFGRFDQLDRWFGDFSPRRFSPSVEVSDSGKVLKITAELPGMGKNDVKLHVDDNVLVISGEKKSAADSQDEGVFRSERYYGYFERVVPLPEDVEQDSAEAEFRNGVLTVRFPKVHSVATRARRIEVKG